MSLYSEIFEQPQVLENLLLRQLATVESLAKTIQDYQPHYVFVAARGTSDNAARYANYLWGSFNQLPLALATPSLFTFYEKPPRLKKALVVGISQSGQSPDIVSVIREGKQQGCLTLAITNAPTSPLAVEADLVFDIQAGEEKAVAATKTYTSQLMAVAMLSAALNPEVARWQALNRVSHWAEEVLKLDKQLQVAAQRYTFMEHCVVLGRGYNYATAFEWSLKLKELTYTQAEPYSSADFLHGPIAMVERGFPVMAVAPQGKVYDDVLKLVKYLDQQLHADLVIISNQEEALELANTPIVIPVDVPEWLTPLISILPAQLFAYYLTKARGLDTETPRTIHKITETH